MLWRWGADPETTNPSDGGLNVWYDQMQLFPLHHTCSRMCFDDFAAHHQQGYPMGASRSTLGDETSYELTSSIKASSSLFKKSMAIKADGRVDGSTDQHCSM